MKKLVVLCFGTLSETWKHRNHAKNTLNFFHVFSISISIMNIIFAFQNSVVYKKYFIGTPEVYDA